MKAPGALVVMSVPVCVVTSVVSRCVFTSVLKCVLRRTHSGSERACMKEAPCVSGTPSMEETPCLDETPSETPCVPEPSCVRATPSETPCASGVFTSVPECVLPGTPCVKGALQGEETTCAREAARVCEPPCVDETPGVSAPAGVVCVSEARVSERPCARASACVRSLYTREMTVAMRGHAAASPGVRMSVNVGECSLGVVTRRCVWRAWRLRLRRL